MQLGQHISEQFNRELESLRSSALAMGGLVEDQLRLALKALRHRDTRLAQKVIAQDKEVNDMEIAIDEACSRVIAKRQPIAQDLRLILSIIKIISDLERIGDGAVKLSKMALFNFNQEQQGLVVNMATLGNIAVEMLHALLDAFARLDMKGILAVYQMDDHLDAEHKQLVNQLIVFMQENPDSIAKVMGLMSGIHNIERVGDRCQNICEHIIYFVEGKDIRHDPDYLMELVE